jgi:lipopolysaccharide transport system permease protein
VTAAQTSGRRAWLFDLCVTLIERQWRIRAKRSYLGIVWPVLSPVGLALLYVLVFKRVFAVPIERYPQFLVCGLLPWTFLTIAVTRSVSSVTGDADVVRKARFPYELLPLTTVANQAFILLVNMLGFVAYLAVTGELRWATLPLAAFPVATIVLLAGAISLLVSLIDVYTRDLRFVVGNVLSVWFFLIPIVYRPRMAPSYLRWFQRIDPVASVVAQLRAVLYAGSPSIVAMVLSLAGSAAVFALALAFFRRRSRLFGALL